MESHNLPATTMSQKNHAPLARTQKDTNKGVSEVDETGKGGAKDVQTVPGNLANNTLLSHLPTIHCCPMSLEPTVISPEDCRAYPATNEGIQQVRNERRGDMEKTHTVIDTPSENMMHLAPLSFDWAEDVEVGNTHPCCFCYTDHLHTVQFFGPLFK